jgi:hypothetical protein
MTGKNDVALITQEVIGAAWRLPGKTLEVGVAMRQDFVCRCVLFVYFHSYPRVHIYSPETFLTDPGGLRYESCLSISKLI